MLQINDPYWRGNVSQEPSQWSGAKHLLVYAGIMAGDDAVVSKEIIAIRFFYVITGYASQQMDNTTGSSLVKNILSPAALKPVLKYLELKQP